MLDSNSRSDSRLGGGLAKCLYCTEVCDEDRWVFEIGESTLRWYPLLPSIYPYTPFAAATWIGFWALLTVTCANYVLSPMRDAIALTIGVKHIPNLTLASTVLALFSSVPIGWLFEAPDPNRCR